MCIHWVLVHGQVWHSQRLACLVQSIKLVSSSINGGLRT
jgi:hypothetical protein